MSKRKKKTPSAEDTRRLAKKVLSNVKLSNIRLFSSMCFNNLDGDRPLPAHAAQKVDINVKPRGRRSLVVVADLGISVGYDSEHEYDSSHESPVLIEATFLLTYAITNEGPTKSEAEAFASATATYNVWPYWREFVQSMTTRMGLPGITIPIFHLYSIVEGNKTSESSKSSPSRKKSKRSKRTSAKKRSR